MRTLPLLALVLTGCGLVYGPADPADSTPVRFTVPKGATASGLGPVLEEQGLIADANRWKIFLKLGADASCVKAGDFNLRPDMTLPEVLATLCGAPLPEDIPFTVVEGWRYRDIDAALAEAKLIKPGEYIRAAENPSAYKAPFDLAWANLEGFLYPETYMVVPSRFTAEAFVQRQLDLFVEKFWTPLHGELGDRRLYEVVTMASLVEREEPTPSNRPLVAGVIWKRLDAGWNLGVDATSRYNLDDWNDRQKFLARLRDPDDPYNTRLRGGLPPTPIGNPGLEALKAAMKPEASDYWYYLHDDARQVHFGRNEAEHEKNRRTWNVY